jgi:hypothetical protein
MPGPQNPLKMLAWSRWARWTGDFGKFFLDLLTASHSPSRGQGKDFSTIFIFYLDHPDHLDQAMKTNDFCGPGKKYGHGPLGPAHISRRASLDAPTVRSMIAQKGEKKRVMRHHPPRVKIV